LVVEVVLLFCPQPLLRSQPGSGHNSGGGARTKPSRCFTLDPTFLFLLP
jgi:hypothetical protein